MELIIFGATGTVGQELIKQAMEKGYSVTAFVRSPHKIQNHSNLNIHQGDVRNVTEVKKALEGKDIVLCALGDGKTGQIRAEGTKNIIEAMNATNTKRLICQTTLGMGESYNNLNFIWKHIMFGYLLRKAFKDHQLQEEAILNSNLHYTIVRPSALTDGEITNNYHAGFNGSLKNLKLKISRADVADFMLQQIHTNDYMRKAVSISN